MRGASLWVSALLVGLLLALPVSAETPGLERVSPKQVTLSVTGGELAVLTTEYTLHLPEVMKVQLITSGPGGHAAQWTIDGVVLGSTDGQDRLETDLLSEGGHAVQVRWSLDSSVPAGDHTLDVYVRQTQDSGSGGQGFPGDHEAVDLHLDRTTPGGSGSAGSGTSGESTGSGSAGSSGSGGGSSTQGGAGNSGAAGNGPADAASSHAAGIPVPDAAVAVLRAGGLAIADGALRFVDHDGDGIYDAVEGGPATLLTRHRAPSHGLFVVQDEPTGAFFVLDARHGSAAPVAPLDGAFDEPPEKAASIEVTVADKEGWIVVSIEDPFPDRELTGLSRSTMDLPLDFMWRANGMIHFIDDPETVYTVHFAPLGDEGGSSDGTAGSIGGLPLMFVLGAVVFLAGAAMVSVALLLRRTR